MQRILGWSAGVSLLLSVWGCSGGELGPSARVPADQRHTLRGGAAAMSELTLPGSSGYNIHLKRSSQDPGANGLAESKAETDTAGAASCRARAARGGTSWAEFKIGHRIDNLSASPQRAEIDVTFGLEHEIDGGPTPAAESLSKAELVLAVVDSRKHEVHRTSLLAVTSDAASGQGSENRQRRLSALLEAGESYDVVLYGRVDATAAEGQETSAALALKGLTMRMSFISSASRPAE